MFIIRFDVVGCEGYRYTQPLMLDAPRRVALFASEREARAALEASADAWVAERLGCG